jgi:hypothetical protein
MTNFADLAAQVGRALGADDAKKSAIIAANPEIFYAFDATELGGMSAHEVAAETLKKRGVRLNSGEDGVRSLELFNQGMDWGRAGARFGGTGGTYAADSRTESVPSFLEAYLNSGAEK